MIQYWPIALGAAFFLLSLLVLRRAKGMRRSVHSDLGEYLNCITNSRDELIRIHSEIKDKELDPEKAKRHIQKALLQAEKLSENTRRALSNIGAILNGKTI